MRFQESLYFTDELFEFWTLGALSLLRSLAVSFFESLGSFLCFLVLFPVFCAWRYQPLSCSESLEGCFSMLKKARAPEKHFFQLFFFLLLKRQEEHCNQRCWGGNRLICSGDCNTTGLVGMECADGGESGCVESMPKILVGTILECAWMLRQQLCTSWW